MVFSEVPNMSDPNADFIQHYKQVCFHYLRLQDTLDIYFGEILITSALHINAIPLVFVVIFVRRTYSPTCFAIHPSNLFVWIPE